MHIIKVFIEQAFGKKFVWSIEEDENKNGFSGMDLVRLDQARNRREKRIASLKIKNRLIPYTSCAVPSLFVIYLYKDRLSINIMGSSHSLSVTRETSTRISFCPVTSTPKWTIFSL